MKWTSFATAFACAWVIDAAGVVHGATPGTRRAGRLDVVLRGRVEVHRDGDARRRRGAFTGRDRQPGRVATDGSWYWCDTVGPEPTGRRRSPRRRSARAGAQRRTLESKFTVSGASPIVGDPLATATGAPGRGRALRLRVVPCTQSPPVRWTATSTSEIQRIFRINSPSSPSLIANPQLRRSLHGSSDADQCQVSANRFGSGTGRLSGNATTPRGGGSLAVWAYTDSNCGPGVWPAIGSRSQCSRHRPISRSLGRQCDSTEQKVPKRTRTSPAAGGEPARTRSSAGVASSTGLRLSLLGAERTVRPAARLSATRTRRGHLRVFHLRRDHSDRRTSDADELSVGESLHHGGGPRGGGPAGALARVEPPVALGRLR